MISSRYSVHTKHCRWDEFMHHVSLNITIANSYLQRIPPSYLPKLWTAHQLRRGSSQLWNNLPAYISPATATLRSRSTLYVLVFIPSFSSSKLYPCIVASVIYSGRLLNCTLQSPALSRLSDDLYPDHQIGTLWAQLIDSALIPEAAAASLRNVDQIKKSGQGTKDQGHLEKFPPLSPKSWFIVPIGLFPALANKDMPLTYLPLWAKTWCIGGVKTQ